jgi:hypothetical protein
MDPVFVKTIIGVLRVLAIVVAWKANISLIWLCERMATMCQIMKEYLKMDFNEQ